MLNKNKKDNTGKYLIYGGIAAFILLVIFVAIQTNVSYDERGLVTLTSASEFNEVTVKDKAVVTVGMASCQFCQQALPVMADAAEKVGATVYYIDLESLSDEDTNTVVNFVSAQIGTDWGVPLTLALESGSVVEEIQGLNNEEVYEMFFQLYALGQTTENNENVNVFGTLEEFNEIVSDDNFVIVVGRNSCPFCQEALPIMDEAAEELNLVINYLDLELIRTEEEYNEIMEWFANAGKEEFAVPVAYAVSGSNITDELVGRRDQDTYKEFFENHMR